jgi:2-keto-3-deoxygluconate permease
LLGNLDKNLRSFFTQGTQVMVPFFAFALGNGLNFTIIQNTGLLGILLGLSVMIITGSVLVVADLFLAKGNGTAGVAAGSTAGAAVIVPGTIATMAPQFAPVAPAATALIATSVVVTAFCTPLLTHWWAKRYGMLSPNYKGKQAGESEAIATR